MANDQVPLRHMIADKIQEWIWAGEIEPGARLNELDLARRFDVSQAPVREALRLLESSGLAKSYPYRGTFVLNPSLEDAEETCELRVYLERRAVELATPKMTEEHLAPLQETVRQMEKAFHAQDVDEMIALDRTFHKTLVDLADQNLLTTVWLQARPLQWAFLSAAMDLKNNATWYVTSHEVLLQTFRSGDLRMSLVEIERHVRSSHLAVTSAGSTFFRRRSLGEGNGELQNHAAQSSKGRKKPADE